MMLQRALQPNQSRRGNAEAHALLMLNVLTMWMPFAVVSPHPAGIAGGRRQRPAEQSRDPNGCCDQRDVALRLRPETRPALSARFSDDFATGGKSTNEAQERKWAAKPRANAAHLLRCWQNFSDLCHQSWLPRGRSEPDPQPFSDPFKEPRTAPDW